MLKRLVLFILLKKIIKGEKNKEKIGILNGFYNGYDECKIYKYALKIPNQNFRNIKEFAEVMNNIENKLIKDLK